MKATGILLAFLDIPAEYGADYNRWYDLDHMPEHVAKDDVLFGRRYYAPAALRDAPGTRPSELTGQPQYATIYFLGGVVDFHSDEARRGWLDVDRRIVKAGRYFQQGKVAFSGNWDLTDIRARSSIQIAPEAIPNLPHRGLIAIVGRAVKGTDGAAAWWDRTQSAEVLDLPGVLAQLRFTPVDETSDLLVHLLFCEDPAAEVAGRLAGLRRFQELTGRYPAHDGSYETVAQLAFDTITPGDYGFLDRP